MLRKIAIGACHYSVDNTCMHLAISCCHACLGIMVGH